MRTTLLVLAGLITGVTGVTWYYYLRLWWVQYVRRERFEGAVPFHVISVGLGFLVLVWRALFPLPDWLTLVAYLITAGPLVWILLYQRVRFLTNQQGRRSGWAGW
jgi:hypothetical protein